MYFSIGSSNDNFPASTSDPTKGVCDKWNLVFDIANTKCFVAKDLSVASNERDGAWDFPLRNSVTQKGEGWIKRIRVDP